MENTQVHHKQGHSQTEMGRKRVPGRGGGGEEIDSKAKPKKKKNIWGGGGRGGPVKIAHEKLSGGGEVAANNIKTKKPGARQKRKIWKNNVEEKKSYTGHCYKRHLGLGKKEGG